MLVTGAATKQSAGLVQNGTRAPPTAGSPPNECCDGTPYTTALIRLIPTGAIPGLAIVTPYSPDRGRNRGYKSTLLPAKLNPNWAGYPRSGTILKSTNLFVPSGAGDGLLVSTSIVPTALAAGQFGGAPDPTANCVYVHRAAVTDGLPTNPAGNSRNVDLTISTFVSAAPLPRLGNRNEVTADSG